MLVDLHVHTSRYSACGRATPEEMMRQAVDVGLDGVVLTEHNLVWPDDEIDALRAQFPRLTIWQGVEITSAEGDDYLLYGLTSAAEHADEPHLKHGTEGERLVQRAHELGLVVVLAHPYRYRDEAPAFLAREPVDGIEIMSANILNYAHGRAVALAEELGAFVVATSDGHNTKALGVYAVRFDSDGLDARLDERALARVLIERRFALCVDAEAIAAWNAEIDTHRDQLERLIGEGLSDSDIREKIPMASGVILRALREGLNVYRPGTSFSDVPSQRFLDRMGCF
jgi:predicted metal-dependent phosphoesterase TrpH